MNLQFHPPSNQITIGGNTFTVTALPLGVLRRDVIPMASRHSLDAASGLAPEMIEMMLKVVYISVSRADPGITLESLENNLLLMDIVKLFEASVAASGMARGAEMGEAPSPSSLSSFGGTSMGLS
jgi:hypothetical protein